MAKSGAEDPRQRSLDLRALAPLAAVGFLVAFTSAFLVSSSQSGVYEARTSLSEANTERAVGPTAAEAADTVRRLEFHGRVAESRPVLERAIERLELDLPTVALGRSLSATVSSDGSALEIAVEDRDPALATALANVIAEEVIAASANDDGSVSLAAAIDAELAARIERLKTLQRRVDRLSGFEDPNNRQRTRLERLTRSLEAAPGLYARLLPFSSESSVGGLAVVDPAVRPTTPVRPLPILDALLAGFLGIIVLLPLRYVPNFLDAVVRTTSDVRDETGLPALAIVPRVHGDRRRPSRSRRPMLVAPDSAAADAYSRVALGVRMASTGRGHHVVLVAAPRRTDAKSSMATNLALALARAGRSVVLVDADLDRPRVHRMLDIANGPGLAEALAAGGSALMSLLVTTPQPGCRVLTAGDVRSHRGEHVGLAAMKRLLDKLAREHDVIIDGPPLRDSAAAGILGPSVDHVVLALAAGHSRRSELRASVRSLQAAHADVLGAVVVQAPPRWSVGLADLVRDPRASRPGRSATAAPSWPRPAPSGVSPYGGADRGTLAPAAPNRTGSMPRATGERSVSTGRREPGPYFVAAPSGTKPAASPPPRER